jgi:hypothetical protein
MSPADPDWLHDAAHAIVEEIHQFLTTAWQVTIAPRRFAAEWSDGERRALNPLLFVLNGLAALGVWRIIWNRLLGRSTPDRPLWVELSQPVWPLLITLLWTAVAHTIIRALGGRRPLRSSLAMVLFTGGGPLALVSALAVPLGTWIQVHQRQPTLTMALVGLLVMLAVSVALIAWPTLALAGVHRVAGWRIAVGVVVATIAEYAFVIWSQIHHKAWLIVLGAT